MRKVLPWILLVALAGCAVPPEDTGSGSAATTPKTDNDIVRRGAGSADASKDAKLVSFRKGEYGLFEGVVRVTNHSDKASDYLIEINVENSAGVQVDTGHVAVLGLAPGKQAREEFTIVSDDAAKAVISEVQRTAAA
jgi:hypothetical protein